MWPNRNWSAWAFIFQRRSRISSARFTPNAISSYLGSIGRLGKLILKGTYYENNTFSRIWGVIFGLWCSNMHTNFEKFHTWFSEWGMQFLKVPRLQLPNERVCFGAPSYVGRGHIWILPPTSPSPSNQSIAKIMWTSRRALGGDVHAYQKQGYSIQK